MSKIVKSLEELNTTADTLEANKVSKSGDTMTGNLEAPSMSIGGDYVSPFSFRNKIINGAMDIWQKGTTFSGGVDTVDRFEHVNSVNSSQSTSMPTGLVGYSLYVIPTSALNYRGVSQKIEASNSKSLAGKTVTLSLWMRASGNAVSSSPFIAVGYANALDDFSTTTDIITHFPTLTADTWTKVQKTFTMPSNASNGIVVTVFIHGTTTTLQGSGYITHVQLEEGSVATPFEQRPIGLELSLCQRYYQKFKVETGNYPIFGNGFSYSTTNADIQIPLITPMREKYSSVEFGGTLALRGAGGVNAVTDITINTNRTSQSAQVVAVSTGLTNDTSYHLFGNGSVSSFIAFNAEL